MTPRQLLDEGENRNGYGVWKDDLYGGGKVLGKKREGRGWSEGAVDEVEERYLGRSGDEESDKMVKSLLRWTGGADGTTIFPGRLPWVERVSSGKFG